MSSTYTDDDLVYVDPDTRSVVSLVEFDSQGQAKPKEMPEKPKLKDGKEVAPRKRSRKRYYPWGTYRTMKKLYRIEGKQKDAESHKTFDEALNLAVQEAYWE